MLNLRKLRGQFSILQLPVNADIPKLSNKGFYNITSTNEEISIFCLTNEIADNFEGKVDHGWCGFFIEGKMDFALLGIIKKIADPLFEAKIAIFAISTFNTDYIFIKETNYQKAKNTLEKVGFSFYE